MYKRQLEQFQHVGRIIVVHDPAVTAGVVVAGAALGGEACLLYTSKSRSPLWGNGFFYWAGKARGPGPIHRQTQPGDMPLLMGEAG